MATLQWRDVNAPNYSTALQGWNLFGNMLGSSASGLTDALADFQKDRSQATEQQVMRAAQAYTDPADYQRALASGQIYRDAGINPEHLTPGSLTNLNSQVTSMIDRATKQQSLTAEQYKQSQIEKTNQGLEASRPAIAKLLSEATGMPLSSEELAQLPAAQLMKLAENTNALKTTKLTNDLTGASVDATKQARADADEIARFTNSFPEATYDRNSATAFHKSYNFSNDRVRQTAAAYLDKYYGSGVVNVDGPAAPGSTGTAGTTGTGAGAGNVSMAPAPSITGIGNAAPTSRKGYSTVVGGGEENLTQTPIGDWEDKIAPRLIEATRNTPIMEADQAEKGSSASGRYQITRKTMRDVAPTVLGKDYRNLPFNEAAQEKIGDTLYSRRNQNNTAMTDEWRGLKRIRGAEAPGAWKDIPWDVARDVIAQYESGDTAVLGLNATMDDVKTYARTRATGTATDTASAASVVPTASQKTADALTAGALRDRMVAAQIEYGSPATARIQRIMSNPELANADFNTVASGLVQQFKGSDDTISKSDMTTTLRRVMREGRIASPAVAAEFVKDSAEGTMFGGRKWYGETSVDDATLRSTIETWKKGGFEQGTDYLRQLESANTGLTSAQAAYDNAATKYRRLESAVQGGRTNLANGLPALAEEVNRAQAQVALARQVAAGIQAPTRQQVEQRQVAPGAATSGQASAAPSRLPTWGGIFHLNR